MHLVNGRYVRENKICLCKQLNKWIERRIINHGLVNGFEETEAVGQRDENTHVVCIHLSILIFILRLCRLANP